MIPHRLLKLSNLGDKAVYQPDSLETASRPISSLETAFGPIDYLETVLGPIAVFYYFS